jgi:hypothetical protein
VRRAVVIPSVNCEKTKRKERKKEKADYTPGGRSSLYCECYTRIVWYSERLEKNCGGRRDPRMVERRNKPYCMHNVGYAENRAISLTNPRN